jgi:hypothetical protein
MKIILLLPAVLLTGCLSFTAPVKQKFPDVPKELLETCPELKLVESTEKLSDVLSVINENYSEYHSCRVKIDAWIQWYRFQKDNFGK